MQLKKWFLSTVMILACGVTFSQTIIREDDPVNDILQRVEQFYTQCDEKLLPPVKSITNIVLQVSQNDQDDLTAEQTSQLEQLSSKLDQVLSEMAAPIIPTVNIDELNTNLQQAAQTLGTTFPLVTAQTLPDVIKASIFENAIVYFGITQKLSKEELGVIELLFSNSEDEEEE